MRESIERMRKLVNENLVMNLRFQMNGELNQLEREIEQELNSRAERTCNIDWRDDSHDTDAGYERDGAYFCTACGADLPYPLQECWDDYQAGNYEKPFNYCPSCGWEVVD